MHRTSISMDSNRMQPTKRESISWRRNLDPLHWSSQAPSELLNVTPNDDSCSDSCEGTCLDLWLAQPWRWE